MPTATPRNHVPEQISPSEPFCIASTVTILPDIRWCKMPRALFDNLLHVTEFLLAMRPRCRLLGARPTMYLTLGSTPHSVRDFSYSATAQARISMQELRESRKAQLRAPEPTPADLQQFLKRESERQFGPSIVGNPAAFVNKAADDIWKGVLKASGNDPEVFKAWRDEIKSRAATQTQNLDTVYGGKAPQNSTTPALNHKPYYL
ncbi:hypothetical protein C8R47DRAFT_17051 [Mycena vitilis]|nr:hypothetical protein C8R47DRAFT_17051 [Mycena vitilis]